MPKKYTSAPCPNCGHSPTSVVSTIREESDQTVLRRRHCSSCDHRWYTLQPPEVVLGKHQVTFQRDDHNSPLFTIHPPSLPS